MSLELYGEMPDSDRHLLQAFAATRDERAFRQLSSRYLGLIFHTALRRTGNRLLAEEASQNVLCALVRKAGPLSRQPERLAAWLHRATIYESLKAMRSESAHQRRKQLRHPDEAESHPPAESPWTDAIPLLDDSLNKLSESDRTVLLLHFFENRTFPQIARALGKSVEAVQKQSRRALEKLARLLRARGVTLSVTAVATGLAAEMAKAAPLPFTAASAASALTATNPTPAFIAMTLSKPKILIPATLLVCAIPLAIQQGAISKASGRNSELLARLDQESTRLSGPTPSRNRPATTSTGHSAADFIALSELWDEARRTTSHSIFSGVTPQALASYEKTVESYTIEELASLIHEGSSQVMDRNKKQSTLRTLILTLAKRDPALALETAIGSMPAGGSFASHTARECGLGNVLGHWAANAPEDAWTWFLKNEAAGKFSGFSWELPNMDGGIGIFTIPLGHSFVESNPALARELLQKVPMGKRGNFLFSLVHSQSWMSGSLDLSGSVAMGAAFRGKSVEKALHLVTLAREFAPMSVDQLIARITSGGFFSHGDNRQLEEFIRRAGLSEQEKAAIAGSLTKASGMTVVRDGVSSIQIDEARASLARRLAPGIYDELLDQARIDAEKADARMADVQIKLLKSTQNPTDEQLVRTLSRHHFKSQIDAALEQAQRIQDPEKRGQVIATLEKQR